MKTILCAVLGLFLTLPAFGQLGPKQGHGSSSSTSSTNLSGGALTQVTNIVHAVLIQSNLQWIAANAGAGTNTTISGTLTVTNTGSVAFNIKVGPTNGSSSERWNFGDDGGNSYSWQLSLDTNRWALQRSSSDTDYPILVTKYGIKLGKSAHTITNIGNSDFQNTTNGTTGVITKNGTRFSHDYSPSGLTGNNSFYGNGAGNFTLTSGAQHNTGNGRSVLGSLTTGGGNTGSGSESLFTADTGFSNTADGRQSLYYCTSCSENTASGAGSLFNLTIGIWNNADGVQAGNNLTNGSGNNLKGVNAMRFAYSASNNVAIGTTAGYYATNAIQDIMIGDNSGYNAANDIFQYRITADTLMTLIGAGATKNNTSILSNSTAIGANAKVWNSNEAVIGDSNVTSTVLMGKVGVGTGSSSKTRTLSVQGTILANDPEQSLESNAYIWLNTGSGNSFVNVVRQGSGNLAWVSYKTGATEQWRAGLNDSTGDYSVIPQVAGIKFVVPTVAYIPTNAAPFTVVSNAPATLITNLNQRATLVLKLAFDDVTGGIPSCTINATNTASTNYFGQLSPTLSGLTLVGTVSVTNDYTYPMQTNSIFKITDTSTGGAAIRVVQALVFEQ